MSSEVCQKCGEAGEDRRTLWHSCLYAMNELGVPFEQTFVHGETFDMVGTKEFRFTNDPRFPALTVPAFSKAATGTLARGFFTLRVCKVCRASWMQAIKQWFHTPVAQREECGTGIFVRENGVSVEISEDAWRRRVGVRESQ